MKSLDLHSNRTNQQIPVKESVIFQRSANLPPPSQTTGLLVNDILAITSKDDHPRGNMASSIIMSFTPLSLATSPYGLSSAHHLLPFSFSLIEFLPYLPCHLLVSLLFLPNPLPPPPPHLLHQQRTVLSRCEWRQK